MRDCVVPATVFRLNMVVDFIDVVDVVDVVDVAFTILS